MEIIAKTIVTVTKGNKKLVIKLLEIFITNNNIGCIKFAVVIAPVVMLKVISNGTNKFIKLFIFFILSVVSNIIFLLALTIKVAIIKY